MRCARCFRPLRVASPDGYGPVCRKSIAPTPCGERDLLGFDIEQAAISAVLRTRVLVNVLAAQARIDLREAFKAARHRLGVIA